MYWFRDGSVLALWPWLAAMAAAWLGGWLIATHAFRLGRRERLIVGAGLGLVLYTWLANLLGHWLPPVWTFALPSLVLLAVGLAFGWRRQEGPWLQREDLRIWPWLLAGLGLFWLFTLWGKGLALFDEHKNLSLISVMANGDIPPRFFFDYPLKYIYHYGFQLYGASLMQLGGMFPWSAFDAAKAILWALTLLLGGLLGQRYIGKRWGGWATAGLLAFASGTRYLLLLLPPGLLLRLDPLIELQGTSALIGKPFSQALISGWTIDGGPPMDYIFGFLNGVMDPLVLAHQGPNTFSVLIFLLVWLLLTRLRSRWAWLPLAALLATWALAWETTYALFMVGLALFAALHYWRERNLQQPHLRPALYAAALSIPIVLTQGGTLTEMARNLLFGIQGPALFSAATEALGIGFTAPLAAGPDFLGFSLRWPPAILSAHLGALSLFSPGQLLVALFELGPVILFTPWITRWAWRRARAGDWPLGVFVIAAWVGFLMPIFLVYQADRDISRLSWQALLTWTLMLLFLVADSGFRWRPWAKQAAQVGLALMAAGGLVIAAIQMTAATTTQLAHRFSELDAQIASQVWGEEDQSARIFGPLGNTTILTGTLSVQLLGEPPERETYDYVMSRPTLEEAVDFLIEDGWDFLYLDNRWLAEHFPEDDGSLAEACIEVSAEIWDNAGVNYRRMLDLRPCIE